MGRDGEEAGALYPARWFYRKHETEPTTEVAMRRSVSEDLYVTLATYDIGDQSAAFQVTVNPLVNWIWLGFALLAFGTGIALLPESSFAFVTARVPAGAATTSLLLLSLLLGGMAAPARAQIAVAGGADLTPEQQALEAELQSELVCLCGSCSRLQLSVCTCSTADGMRRELNGQVAAGKDRDGVYQYFIDAYGSQEPLGSPIGAFNQLVWLLPLLLGGASLAGIGLVAVRWSRRDARNRRPAAAGSADERQPAAPVAAGAAGRATASAGPADERLEARLDDELRNLD